MCFCKYFLKFRLKAVQLLPCFPRKVFHSFLLHCFLVNITVTTVNSDFSELSDTVSFCWNVLLDQILAWHQRPAKGDILEYRVNVIVYQCIGYCVIRPAQAACGGGPSHTLSWQIQPTLCANCVQAAEKRFHSTTKIKMAYCKGNGFSSRFSSVRFRINRARHHLSKGITHASIISNDLWRHRLIKCIFLQKTRCMPF